MRSTGTAGGMLVAVVLAAAAACGSSGASSSPGGQLPLGSGPLHVDVDTPALVRPLQVNIWASSCGPCRDELPLLQRVHEVVGDKLAVPGIDFSDAALAAALQLAAQSGVTYPSAADPGAAVRPDLRVIGLPETVFVDAAGRVTAVVRGPLTSYAEAAALVHQHLGVTLPADAGTTP